MYASIRSIMIFDEIFSACSNIYLVVNEHTGIDYTTDILQGINIYKKYNKWVLDYDRERISQIFSSEQK